jgi:CO dehydrogenase nickel-insertion accessory protein CooC1
MSEALGIRRFGVVLNKSTAADDLAWMETEFGAANVFGRIPFDARIAAADRAGTSLLDNGPSECLEWFRAIQRRVEHLIEK